MRTLFLPWILRSLKLGEHHRSSPHHTYQPKYLVVAMKLAFAIATVTSLRQAAVIRADCNFGSNYTVYFNSSDYCSFDIAVGIIRNFSESNTISSGDTNVTTTTYRGDNMAIWKMGDKDSTVQCYPDISGEKVLTSYPNGSSFAEDTGDFAFGLDSVNNTVADGVPLSSPGLFLFQGGRVEFWSNKGETGGEYWTYTKAEGDITDLCEVLGGGAAPAPTPTPPTTEAPSSGQMAAVTIIPGIAAAILNYFFN
jgi:hypothetical protein